jgi:TolB-like protein
LKPEKIIEKLLEKYRFREEVPPETRKRMLSLRKSAYRSIMKRYGRWTILLSTGASLYFWLKKFGIGLTIQQAVAAVTAFVTLALAGLSLGTVYTVKKYIMDEEKPVIKENSLEKPEPETDLPETGKSSPVREKVSCKIHVKPLAGENTEPDVLNSFRRGLAASMTKKGGKNTATLKEDTGSPFIVTGSIVRLGTTYRVSLRLVERETSRVILMESATAGSREKLRKIYEEMAVKMVTRL